MRKRIWLPALFVLAAAAALIVAVVRSDTSRVIIYNETGVTISALRISACGQEKLLQNMAQDESFRWKMRKSGSGGEIAFETAAISPWRWQGGYIKPRGGYRVTLRLQSGGEVEVQTELSFWQTLLTQLGAAGK